MGWFTSTFDSDKFREITEKWPIGKFARLRINGNKVQIIGYNEAYSIEVRLQSLQTLHVRDVELEEDREWRPIR